MTNFEKLKSYLLTDRITPEVSKYLDKELFYLECNDADCAYVLKCYDELKQKNQKTENQNNAMIYYVLGLTDKKPVSKISQAPTTLPDIDYDTDARDEIKTYLVNKYGKDYVSLLGTYNTLKVKGALKDVVRQIREEMTFDQVNKLTKKFDIIKRTDHETVERVLKEHPKYDWIEDYDSEIAFFYAVVEMDSELRKWFEDNKEVEEAVTQLLGNAKSTGIHAGGIVVSGRDIKTVVPLTFSKDEDLWVTQPEMGDVEGAGLIKYDILGLNTGGDLNRCIKLVNKRHGTKFTLSNIPLDDQKVLDEFQKGNTISIFQFSTDLVRPSLPKLKSIDSIVDLAIITSIYRPGPLNMEMDQSFIRRKNGVEALAYVHPSLEKHLKDSYGIVIFQESVMQICIDVGGISPSDSVVVLKAMGKKQRDKLVKFKDKFIANAIKVVKMEPKVAEELWNLLESFAEYGFNKSHAIAYACVSYLCMWFKTYYPLEWYASVLSGSDKEDFKIMYQHWNQHIDRPNINKSQQSYFIDDEAKKVIMPFTAINGVGDAAVVSIIACQPFNSFEEFFKKIDKRKVNKNVFMNLIFSGCFDQFKIPEVSENKWRKHLVREFIELRHKDRKPAKLEKEQDEALLREVESMNRGKILMKEIGLLNFTSFDYHTYYKDKMTTEATRLFGQPALKPHEVMGKPNKTVVVVGGAIESIENRPIKTGKFMGKDRMIIKLTNQGGSIDVVIMPWILENDDAAGGSLRKLVELTPIIIKGKINIWNDLYSISFDEGITLV
jgi:DNA-directed DNA polymerase III PolC